MRVLYLPGPTSPADDVRAALKAAHPDSDFDVCAPEAATDWLSSHPAYDAVVVDGSSQPPDDQWLASLRAQRSDVPIAVLVAPGDVPGEARALLAGADASMPQAPGTLPQLGSLLMRIRRRDADPDRRDWRLWFAGRDTELRRAVAARLGRRVLLMSLSRDGKLVPMLEDPANATALIVDARDAGDDMLAGLQRVRDVHPTLATVVVAEESYHAAFLRMGADDCVPPGTDVERLLLAVERLSSHRQMAAEVVALRVRENRLRAVVEYLPEAVVLVAASRSVLAINLAGLELLGAAEARHVIGGELTPWLAADDDQAVGRFIDEVSAGATRELTASTRHDTPHRVSLRAVPFQREPGKPASALITVRLLGDAVPVTSPAEPATAHDGAELDALRTRLASLDGDEAGRAEAEQRQRELVATLEHELEISGHKTRELAEALAAQQASAGLVPPSIAALEQAVADERARVAQLSATLDEARMMVEQTAAALSSEQAMAGAREAERLALDAALDEARTALDNTRAAQVERGAHAQTLEAALAESRAALEHLSAELAERDTAERDRRAGFEQARARVGDLERALAEARLEIEASRSSAGEQSEAAQQALARHAAALEGMAGLERQLDEARAAHEGERRSRDQQVAALTEALAEAERARSDREALLAELQQALADTRAELAARTAEVADVLFRVDAAETASSSLSAQLASLTDADAARRTLAEALDEARQALVTESAERQQTQMLADQLQARIDAAAADLAAVRADRAALDERLAQAHETARARAAEADDLRRERDEGREALAQLEREATARLRSVESEREALRRDVGQWQVVREELPALREAQRRMVALEGQVAETQLVRAQALALESEVAELRDTREQAQRLAVELAEVRAELEARPAPPARLEAAVDEETRWLLYDVASIGHLTTTPDAHILGANDIAAQLLGHFSRDALQASGRLPQPLLEAAGAFAHRPTRFEVCLQHGEDGPLHWIVGLATPHAGVPATVTWMLIDVSEQRLHARRSRFLRRMEAMTHVLSAATAESFTLVERATPLLDAAAASLGRRDDLDVEGTRAALTRTQAVLTQLSGFARKRARRAGVRDVRLLLDTASPVLVHVAGEDVSCAISQDDQPLHVTLESAEFEHFLTALTMAGRDALPLGGRLTLATRAVTADTRDEGAFFTRPTVELGLRAEGYGVQPPEQIPALQEAAARLGATLTTEFDTASGLVIQVRMARVFVMA